jgi:uncharacterized protein (TIGR03437 family)
MSRIKGLSWFLFSLILAAGILPAQTGGRLFLFPQSSGQSITVLDAGTLASVGVIPSPANVTSVVGVPDGAKYYIIANNSANTLTIVSGSNLSVVRQISLGANASNAVVTPDGRRLLITAGTLRIFDTSTDNEVGNVPAGSGPTDIEVTQDSTRAFVMAASGTITVVNLTNNQQVAQYSQPGPVSIALLPSNFRLLILNSDGTLRAINPNNGNETLNINVSVRTGRVLLTPDGSRAVILNRGFSPQTSVVVELSTNATRDIGTGTTQFDQMVIADNATAYGLVAGIGTINKIDLATGTPTVMSLSPATTVLAVSPSGKNLYAVSFQNRTVLRIDVATNSQAANQTVSLPPVGASLFGAPATVAAAMTMNGGDRQNVLAGQTTPFPLTVKLTTTDGTPVFNQPVTFSTSKTGVTFSPAQPSRTNSRGVAAAFVTVPPVATTLQPAPEEETSAQAASAPDDTVDQFGSGVENITISATAQNTSGVNFTLSVGTTTGLTVVSGSNQIARPSQQYALPLVARVTGTDGFPLVNASVRFFSTGGAGIFPLSQVVTTDGDGIARAVFTGGQLPPTSPNVTTAVTASVEGLPDLGSVSFFLTLATALPFGMEILGGDNQEGDIGTTLLQPLCVVIGGSGAFGPRGLLGVYWQVLDGPDGVASASLNPTISITDSGGRTCTQVTIGNRAGNQDIIIRAYMPTVPDNRDEVRFRAKAKGGPPARIDIRQGNNQEGRPGQTLATALRVRVFDIGGNVVPLPNTRFPLSFSVEPSRAGAVSNFFQQPDGEASVLVTIALNYVGDFKVIAIAGDGRAEFNFRSVSQPAAIVQVSGQSQSVGVGGTTAQPVIARINDAQGGPVPAIPVTFSGPSSVTFVPAQGPTGNPITINTGADGRAAVNVRINAGTAPGTVTITATASVGNPAAPANVTFSLIVTGRTPSFTSQSVVNAASFVAGMVPGGLATLFGTGLSEVTGLEFPGGATTHKGVQLKLGGQAMPLFLVRNEGGQEQINFQVRSDIPGGSTVTLEVSNNGATFSVASIPVLRAQPGIFEYTPQGSALKYAAALKTDFTVMGPNNRVSRGGGLSIYLTGGGPSLPLLPTGQAAPSNPLATTFFQPTVGIGGRGATVLFSGLAPGFIGLYQINVLIAEDAPVGEAITLDVIIEGTPSQTTRIAIQ